ncbi:hypothetical protein PVAND_013196 [Polypedilum vanderplanki]|uniref:SAM domain-containing protein n=1 Tax=Polypedilum vanderplanki TaxID=319348 RepID=A0A9J6CPX5_POLVA|nr:hypothetical protein PVAND_013196 [Polypedilum vanderplanki]
MSKRKTRTKSMFVDKNDLVFEDDSDPELLMTEINKSAEKSKQGIASDLGSTRVSSRAKKTKNIYDPSEFNGPVHKKKKEALEAAQNAALNKKLQKAASAANISQNNSPGTKSSPKSLSKPTPKTPRKQSFSKSPGKPQLSVKTPTKVVKSLKTDQKAINENPGSPSTVAQISKHFQPILKSPTSNLTSPTLPVQTLSPSKDPKRIRKEKLIPLQDYDAQPSTSTRARSVSTSGNSEFEKASTVEMNSERGKIPNVSKWTSKDVYNYFVKQGFEEKDARTFLEQEIDGETLLILRREDLANLNLRVGVFIKMWNRIVTFQSGSNDVTQGWK